MSSCTTNHADRYIPPRINHEKSNIKNSENTVLFLVSCFEYILAGVVLNAGPPFRESALKNCMFDTSHILAFC